MIVVDDEDDDVMMAGAIFLERRWHVAVVFVIRSFMFSRSRSLSNRSFVLFCVNCWRIYDW